MALVLVSEITVVLSSFSISVYIRLWGGK